jgi:hypothetical protein
MRCAASRRPVWVLIERCLEGAMIGGVLGDSVLPAAPDDLEPGAGQDAHGAGMVVSTGSHAVVQVGRPCRCIGDPSKITDTSVVHQ